MEETNELVMDIDGDGASDNIIMEQQIQYDEKGENDKKVKLSELPKEILEQILIHLNDEHLLTASQVCKSFASAAETAFAQKYSNKYYCIHPKKLVHKVMLTKYGGKMQKIYMNYQDGELLDLIEQNCCSLKSVTFGEFYDTSKIHILKGLKEIKLLQAVCCKDLDLKRETCTEFINNNHDLEILDIGHIQNNLLDILDGRLNMLKHLTLRRIHFDIDLPNIRLKSLERLEMKLYRTVKGFTNFLQAMNCNAIKSLDIDHSDGFDDDIIHGICSFKTLVSLRLKSFNSTITENHLRKLADHLPNLTELSIRLKYSKSNAVNNICSVQSILPKLKKLTINLGYDDFMQILNYLKNSIYDFHACFAKTNTEIEIIFVGSAVMISKDRILVSNEELDTFELYWMDNLNDRSVRKEIDGFWHKLSNFKFVNNCADQNHPFDISTLMHTNFGYTNCLDIKSNGPITVNANATRHPDFFPHLEKLKIHLVNHTAIDFLQKLDANFCKRIEKLWLNTKGVHEHQEPEQGSDMTSILAKFENLKALHLNPSSAKFDAEYLFSVCQKLKDLHIRREW